MTEIGAETVDRYADLKAFVAEWHRPLEPGDGYSQEEIGEAEEQLGLRLPEALRQMYALIGKRTELTDEQAHLVPLQQLEIRSFYEMMTDDEDWQVENDVAHYPRCVVIYEENQYLYSWVIREEDFLHPDPPVFIEDTDGLFGREPVFSTETPLTAFATMMVAWETQGAGPFQSNPSPKSVGDADKIAGRMLNPLTGYPLSFGDTLIRLYVGSGILASTEKGEWFNVIGRDRATLDMFIDTIESA